MAGPATIADTREKAASQDASRAERAQDRLAREERTAVNLAQIWNGLDERRSTRGEYKLIDLEVDPVLAGQDGPLNRVRRAASGLSLRNVLV